jgi:cytochrome c biogenesis protein CcmG/thiol:disulfide interchange protein DsbE
MSRRAIMLMPLALLLLFIAAVAWRLASPSDTMIRSKLEGQKLPEFVLSPAIPGKAGLSSADLATGSPRLLNMFASWCVPCITEAPILMRLRQEGVAIEGIAIRDRSSDVAEFLGRHGDPFERIGGDPESRVQIALGSSGVPETFVVDGQGIIRAQHIGPITEGDLPAIRRALEVAR